MDKRKLLARSCVALGAKPSDVAYDPSMQGMAQWMCTRLEKWCQSGWRLDDLPNDDVPKIWEIWWFWLGPGSEEKLCSDTLVWSLMATFSAAMGTWKIWKQARNGKWHRALRCLPPKVHAALLMDDFDADVWQVWVERSLRWPWRQADDENSVVYILWHERCSTWYVGRTHLRRKKKSAGTSGCAARYREHVFGTYVGKTTQRRDAKYKTWRKFRPECLFWVPVWCDSHADVAAAEDRAIRILQPPTQHDGASEARRIGTRKRCWPRFRCKKSLEEELVQNLHRKRHDGMGCGRKDLRHMDFNGVVNVFWRRFGIRRADLLAKMWQPHWWWLLVLFVAEKGTILRYDRMWRLESARAACLRLWALARTLDSQRRRAARQKVERFCKTAKLLDVRCVPSP